mgnify:FL=1
MDVLILAAGFGTRMEDLTKQIPKPLLKINQKPLIAYALDLIEKIKFEEIYVNIHYQPQSIQKYLIENFPKVKISHEKELLGTGGGIKKIQNKDLFILNTDNLWDPEFILEIENAINFFQDNNNIENLLLVNSNDNSKDLEISNESTINFPAVKKNTQFQGCHLLRKNALDSYPLIFDIPQYWKDCSKRKKLFGFETSIINTHIGTKNLYLKYQK